MEKINRNKRIEIAEKTLEIIETGLYKSSKEDSINISNEIKSSIDRTFTVTPDGWEEIMDQVNRITTQNHQTTITVLNDTTIAALSQISNKKVAVLNFASAKNPGGGFIGGALAQEESLARASCLYASLKKDMSMYHFNRDQSSFLYSDYMIYSPDVLFWFKDNGEVFDNLLKADVITSPAPNKNAILQHNSESEMAQIETVFKNRIEKVLALAAINNIDTLILGAWGCGVFWNEPQDVAKYFKEIINEKFKNNFHEIIFAVFDTSEKKINYLPFQDTFQ